MNRYLASSLLLTGFAVLLIWRVDQRGAQSGATDADISLTVKYADQVKYPKPPGKRPSDWFLFQRSWPFDTLSQTKRLAALSFAQQAQRRLGRSSSAYSAITWEQAGPTNIPGRITDVEATGADYHVVYAGSAAGGVFKSTDTGKTWTAIFDDVGIPSIGDIAIDPTDHGTIYVGTGEVNPAFDTYEGLGVYKSTDSGQTWAPSGLQNSRRIARIIVDKNNPNVVFAGVGGKHFTSGGGDTARGVYKSIDGGATWTRKLFVTDSTACIDLALFADSQVVLAAMWERIRYVDQPSQLGGITSHVWRSTDHGETWLDFALGLPSPAVDIGRIGLAVDEDGATAYALYANSSGEFIGLYRSTDLGFTWTRANDATLEFAPLNASWSGGWYFGQVRTAPSDPSIVYALGFHAWRGIINGDFWTQTSGVAHVDHHALWIHPTDPDIVYDGCDGGVNFSTDGGATWQVRVNQPSTQFYAVEIDPQNPDRYYGGTQDNGTSRTTDGDPGTWLHILGGDGFQVNVDFTDSNVVYAESQNGWLNKSTNMGASWSSARSGLNYNSHRHAWNTPVVMDPNDNLTLYYGSNIVHKTTDGAANWFDFSPDLTDGPHARGNHGVVSTISPAPTNSDVVYVGTDDGNVWVTQNAGANWTQIDATLPDRWVTRVAADPRHENIAYVTITGYFSGSDTAHVFRTEDFGATWTPIAAGLPDAPVNDIIPSPHDSLTLWIGTDYGVYVTENLGATWMALGSGIPQVPVHDIDFHPESGRMIAGTHGRSIFSASLPVPPPTCCDLAGDTDNSGSVNIADVTYQLGRIFGGGPAAPCCAEADADGSGSVNIADVTYVLAFIFSSGPAPFCGPPGLSGC